MRDRFVREELRDQVELAVTKAQPIEHQRHRRRSHADLLAVTRPLLVKPVSHADLPTDLRNDDQMVEMLDDVAWRHVVSGSFYPSSAPWGAQDQLLAFTLLKSCRRVNPNCEMWASLLFRVSL